MSELATDWRILVVAAHADDETIGCGGTIAKFARLGHPVSVLLPIRRIDVRGTREWENLLRGFAQACELLGATALTLDTLIPEDEARAHPSRLADAILPYIERHDTIISHHPGDVNYVHRAVSEAVEVCTRPFRRRKDVWLMPIATTTDQGFFRPFEPNLHVLLEASDIEKKVAAMKFYSSEHSSGRHPEDLRLRAALSGREVGAEFAESFQIVHSYR
jgi:LmbE family N-acetylglucosaminyl deacetylase